MKVAFGGAVMKSNGGHGTEEWLIWSFEADTSLSPSFNFSSGA